MSENRIYFVLVTAGLMLLLLRLDVQPIAAGVASVAVMVTASSIIIIFQNVSRRNLLEDKCDPEAFLDRTQKQRNIFGKSAKMDEYLNIDKAAGLMTMGKFEQAHKILQAVDQNKLSKRNGTLLVYKANLMLCLFELGDIKGGEELYEPIIALAPPSNRTLSLAIDVMIAERFFFLGRFEESRQWFTKLLDVKMSKHMRLSTFYRLAMIEEVNGDLESAKNRYNQVIKEGNKLWIADQARRSLDSFND